MPSNPLVELLKAQNEAKEIQRQAVIDAKEATQKAEWAWERAQGESGAAITRGKIGAADAVAQIRQKQAEQAAKAKEAGKPTPHPVETTTAGLDTQMNLQAPMKTMGPSGAEDILGLVSGGQGAQQGGPSVDVGGQNFQAPELVGSVQRDTGYSAQQVSPSTWMDVPESKTRFNVEQNALTPGDVLRGKIEQEQFRETMVRRKLEFGAEQARLYARDAHDFAIDSSNLAINAAAAAGRLANDSAQTAMMDRNNRQQMALRRQSADASFYKSLTDDGYQDLAPQMIEMRAKNDWVGMAALTKDRPSLTAAVNKAQLASYESQKLMHDEQAAAIVLQRDITKDVWARSKGEGDAAGWWVGASPSAAGGGTSGTLGISATGKLTSKSASTADPYRQAGIDTKELYDNRGNPTWDKPVVAESINDRLAAKNQVMAFGVEPKIGTGVAAWVSGDKAKGAVYNIPDLFGSFYTYHESSNKALRDLARDELVGSGFWVEKLDPNGKTKHLEPTTANPYDYRMAQKLEHSFERTRKLVASGSAVPDFVRPQVSETGDSAFEKYMREEIAGSQAAFKEAGRTAAATRGPQTPVAPTGPGPTALTQSIGTPETPSAATVRERMKTYTAKLKAERELRIQKLGQAVSEKLANR